MTDELSITANGQTIKGWIDIAVTRGIENFPSSFVISMTEKYTDGTSVTIIPGTPCEIKLGNDKVLTGYVDVYSPSITADTHDIHVSGRSKCQDLVDCSAVLSTTSQMISDKSPYELAQQLCKPYEINVINKSGDDGKKIVQMIANLGETPYEIIERAARWNGYLIYDDVDGNLVLDRVGSTKMASGFQQGTNVQTANLTLRTDQRMMEYITVWQTMGQQSDESAALDTPDFNKTGFAEDKGMKSLKRPKRSLYIVSQLVDASSDTPDLGQAVADWECNRRFGRSQVVTLVTDSWRDSSGKLWQPNSKVTCDIPAINVPKKTEWVIASVTYQRNLYTGTTAQLTLMPPEAFSIEPISLMPADADFLQALHPTNDEQQATSSGGGLG